MLEYSRDSHKEECWQRPVRINEIADDQPE